MKKTNLYYTLIAFSCLFGCNNSEKKQIATVSDPIVNKECYLAIDEKDTAYLTVETSKTGKITGDLLIKYFGKPENNGKIEGKFSADTLFADYSFILGTYKERTYKNPLAFLKKDNKLILGVGAIETAYGRSYFVKGKPINFEQGRFSFELANCK